MTPQSLYMGQAQSIAAENYRPSSYSSPVTRRQRKERKCIRDSSLKSCLDSLSRLCYNARIQIFDPGRSS